ncbi:hypothetical protein LAZ40_06705 [Cereibacter sphaeroides]|uniref:hypothetical protein n=1 Tax=Cereibacter sphaeroides TaxID=1063 RepID=UPI001F3388D8|nr:hypothetical protein [Cereibacter sphaeroides]MCE6958736.1 hypothetical protein [Cereibacter sphaeroides]MCE6973390.1 hypothetical protein [Cereibacter sphaeroides]
MSTLVFPHNKVVLTGTLNKPRRLRCPATGALIHGGSLRPDYVSIPSVAFVYLPDLGLFDHVRPDLRERLGEAAAAGDAFCAVQIGKLEHLMATDADGIRAVEVISADPRSGFRKVMIFGLDLKTCRRHAA